MPSGEKIEALRRMYPAGAIVELIYMDDPKHIRWGCWVKHKETEE